MRKNMNCLLFSMPFFLSGCWEAGGSGEKSNQDGTSFTSSTPFAYIQRNVHSTALSQEEQYQSLRASADQTPTDINSPYAFSSGAALMLRSDLSPDSGEKNILSEYFGSNEYDTKDLNVSADGRTLIFAAHGPAGHLTDYSWNIYEYNFKSGKLRRIIKDDQIANAGHDTTPTYTEDGSIVFSSNRAAGSPDIQTILDNTPVEENCYKVTANEEPSLLHRMSNRGTDIVQLTAGSNHDTKPTTLKDGRIAFVRWNRSYEVLPNCDTQTAAELARDGDALPGLNTGSNNTGLASPDEWSDLQKCANSFTTPVGQALATNHYTVLRISSDGAELHQLYPTVSTAASDEGFLKIEKLLQGESGHLLASIKHEYNNFAGGDLLQLGNTDNSNASSDTVFAGLAPSSMTGERISLYPYQISEKGWYSALWPYRDGSSRVLVSWSQCIYDDDGVDRYCNDASGTADQVETRYGVWVYDGGANSKLPIIRSRKNAVFTDLALGHESRVSEFPFAPYRDDYLAPGDEGRVICNDPSVVEPDEDNPSGDSGSDSTGNDTDGGDAGTGDGGTGGGSSGDGGNIGTDGGSSGDSGNTGTDGGSSGDSGNTGNTGNGGSGSGDGGTGDGGTGDGGSSDTGSGDTGSGDGGSGEGGDTGADTDPSTPIATEDSFPVPDAVQSKPNIMLVLDRSGSMRDQWKNDSDGKWNNLITVVDNVITGNDSDMQFGALLFPATYRDEESPCSVNSSSGENYVAIGEDTQTSIKNALSTNAPKGGTPTREAIYEAATLFPEDHRPRAMVLVTDGLANCQDDTGREEDYDSQVHDAVAQAFESYEIPTYVVGIDIESSGGAADQATMNQLAEDGGAPREDSATKYYEVGDILALQDALDEIAVRVETDAYCKLTLSSAVASELFVTLGEQTLINVDSCSGATVGYELSDSVQDLLLCESTCASFRNGTDNIEASYLAQP